MGDGLMGVNVENGRGGVGEASLIKRDEGCKP